MRTILILLTLFVSVLSSCVDFEKDFELKGDVVIKALPKVSIPLAYGEVKLYSLIDDAKLPSLRDDDNQDLYKIRYLFPFSSDKDIKDNLKTVLGGGDVTFEYNLDVPVGPGSVEKPFSIPMQKAKEQGHDIDSFTLSDDVNETALLTITINNMTGTRVTLDDLGVSGLDITPALDFSRLSMQVFEVGATRTITFLMKGKTVKLRNNNLEFTVRPTVSAGLGNVNVGFKLASVKSFTEIVGKFSEIKTELPDTSEYREKEINGDGLKPATYKDFNLEQKEYKAEVVIKNGYNVPMKVKLLHFEGCKFGCRGSGSEEKKFLINKGNNDEPIDIDVLRGTSSSPATIEKEIAEKAERFKIKELVDFDPSKAYFEVETLLFPGAGKEGRPKIGATIRSSDEISSSLSLSVIKATIDKSFKVEAPKVKIVALNVAKLIIKGTSEYNAELTMHVEPQDADRKSIGDKVTVTNGGGKVLVPGRESSSESVDISGEADITKEQAESLLNAKVIKISADINSSDDKPVQFTEASKLDIKILLRLEGEIEVGGEINGSNLNFTTQ